MNVYFASDLHLSLDAAGKIRERIFIDWLEKIRYSADKIFLLGDMFEFWFEYKNVIPLGFARFWGKLAELADQGIEIHYFAGNHDMWMQENLSKEIGIILHKGMTEFEIGSCRFLLGHGHELLNAPAQKLLFGLYNNKLICDVFASIHPRWGMSWGNNIAVKNRKSGTNDAGNLGRNDLAINFACRKLEKRHYDYFIFGHTHLPACRQLSPQSYYINTGDWINNRSYAVFDGKEVRLNHYSAKPDRTKNIYPVNISKAI